MSEKSEKREGFRFSKRTIDNLSALVEMGLARNKTEAIDIALEHIVTEEKTKLMMKGFGAQTQLSTEKLVSPINPLMNLITNEGAAAYI